MKTVRYIMQTQFYFVETKDVWNDTSYNIYLAQADVESN